ncbi:LPS export ABC transporter permease LptF [Gynuella sunshinyii]|uniref:Lipopolysaccharide export system permease protein LptF n=1 Tax=Gynuella sunshinyii YC6258 TaxID=1445510 RepID=A0A0C5VU01_9GAMM|nr:LPS export ABC transporter permease LptF [Gynuella sunshinyii]AJQ96748.1 putative permease [Gynuella sunshinyii YC6258]
MIIVRYLSRQIFFPTFAITGVIVVMTMSNWLRRWLEDAVSGQGASGELFVIILYYVPLFLQEALPAGFLLGILIAYGRMYSEYEMTALFACGFQYRQLVKVTLVPAGLLAVFLWVNNLWLSPWAQQHAAQAWAEQDSLTPFDLINVGRFMKVGNNGQVMYVGEKSGDGQQLSNIFLVNSPEEIYYAQGGEIRVDRNSGSRYLVLTQGVQQQGIPFQSEFNLTDFREYGVKIAEQQKRPRTRNRNISTVELLKSDNIKHKAELMWRILTPLNILVAVFIAVPLSKINPRQGRFLKVFPAVLLYAVFNFLLNDWDKNVSKGRIPLEYGIHILQFGTVALCLFFTALPSWLRKRKHG